MRLKGQTEVERTNFIPIFFRYLVEDQLKGPSSVEGYIQALLNGSRFIESKTSCAQLPSF